MPEESEQEKEDQEQSDRRDTSPRGAAARRRFAVLNNGLIVEKDAAPEMERR